MTVKGKIDQKIPPGALIGASIRVAGNSGCVVSYDHAPTEKKDGPSLEPRREDVFASIEEACHAIAQAAGGNSELQEYEEGEKKGKAAA